MDYEQFKSNTNQNYYIELHECQPEGKAGRRSFITIVQIQLDESHNKWRNFLEAAISFVRKPLAIGEQRTFLTFIVSFQSHCL